ncbi:MAG: peroxiredoxin [Massilia sp.]
MKRLLITLGALAAFTLPAHAALPVGHNAPDIALPASQAGKSFQFSLKQSLRQGPVVVYFYPAAFTGGCSLQAHEFAVNQDKFKAAGASVIGVSLDSIDRLNAFSADPASCAGKVPVASDLDGKTAQAYDVAIRQAAPGRTNARGDALDHGLAERQTFVITADGKIAAIIGGVAPDANVAKALELVQQLAAKKS